MYWPPVKWISGQLLSAGLYLDLPLPCSRTLSRAVTTYSTLWNWCPTFYLLGRHLKVRMTKLDTFHFQHIFPCRWESEVRTAFTKAWNCNLDALHQVKIQWMVGAEIDSTCARVFYPVSLKINFKIVSSKPCQNVGRLNKLVPVFRGTLTGLPTTAQNLYLQIYIGILPERWLVLEQLYWL